MTPKGTRPIGFAPQSESPAWSSPEPGLMGDARRALGGEHPLDFLMLVSTLLSLVDPRDVNPFERDRRAGPSREELLHTFADVDRDETSALLVGFAALGSDETE